MTLVVMYLILQYDKYEIFRLFSVVVTPSITRYLLNLRNIGYLLSLPRSAITKIQLMITRSAL